MTNTVALTFNEYGQAQTGQSTVVLLHPFPFDGRLWHDVARCLEKQQLHVIVPNLRGCADSPLGSDEPEIALLGKDVWRLLDELEVHHPIIMGISLGGYVAMEMLRQRLHEIVGLGLIDTKATADPIEVVHQRKSVAASRQAVEEFLDGVSARLLSPATQRNSSLVVEQVQQWASEASSHTIAWLQHAMADRPDSVADLARFSGPTLLIRGAQDVVSTKEDYEVMQQTLQHHTMVVLPDCGHLPPVENPSATCSAISNWLTSL